MPIHLLSQRIRCIAMVLLCAFPVWSLAQTFEEAVSGARATDAQYAAQRAAVETRRMQARQAGGAFWPSISAAYVQKDTSAAALGRTTQTLTVTQPLLSYDRYLSLQQSELLDLQANSDEQKYSSDLKVRVFKAMADIVRNQEAIRVTQIQIDSISEQLKRAVRLKELGQGTVTDISTLDVSLATAQANLVGVRNALGVAEANFQQITGISYRPGSISLEYSDDRTAWTLDELSAAVRAYSPGINSARIALDQAVLAEKKDTAKYMPQVVAQAYKVQYSDRESVTASGIAVSLSLNYGVPQYYDQRRIASEIVRAQESLRYAEQAVQFDLSRAYSAVQLRKEEMAARIRAVEHAKLSVDANTKSYSGGVKSNIDVLTSYRTLAEAEMAAINARLAYGEATLQLSVMLPERN